MDVLDFLREYDVPHKTGGESPHVTNGWTGILCPYCDAGAGNYGLGINLAYGSCTCWKCGPHRLLDVLAKVTGLSPKECFQKLGGLGFVRRRSEDLHVGKLILPKGLGPLLPLHLEYLRGRGLDPTELVRLWKLQGIGLSHRLGWRLFIPVHLHGKTVSWTTRAVVDSGVRYVSADRSEEAVPAKSVLFGEDYCRHAMIVCEGPFDVFRLGPGAVATLGTSYTRQQLLRMVEKPVRAVCFDSEPAAQARARRLVRELSGFPGRTYQVKLDADDPGSASKWEVSLIRRKFLEG